MLNILLPLITIIANLIVGYLVFKKNSKNQINITFSILTLCLTLWTFAIFMYWQTGQANDALWWSRMAYFVTAPVASLFLFFSIIFFPAKPKLTSIAYFIIFFPTLFVMLLSLTPYIVKDVESLKWGFNLVPGRLYFVFSIYFLGYFGYALVNLILKYIKSSGLIKVQTRYIFIAFFLGAIVGVTFNLILPAVGITKFTRFGTSGAFILCSIIAYAIIRHKLMDIEVVIKRGAVYSALLVLLVCVYAAIVGIWQIFLAHQYQMPPVFLAIIGGLIIALSYRPLENFFSRITDKIFFKQSYDFRLTLFQASRSLATMVDLDIILDFITARLVKDIKISSASIFLWNEREQGFVVKRTAGLNKGLSEIKFHENHDFIKFFGEKKDFLIIEEVEREYELTGRASRKEILKAVLNDLKVFDGGIILPILFKDKIKGFLYLGNKFSGDVFSNEDIAVLTILVNQTAISIQNALSIEEIREMKVYNENIIESMTNGVITLDLEDRVIKMNKVAEELTGIKPQEAVGRDFAEIFGKNFLFATFGPDILHHKIPFTRPVNYIREEKSYVYSVSAAMLHDSNAKNIGAVITFQDITEKVLLEERIRRDERLAYLGSVTAGVAHEIKNPLSSIKLFVKTLPKRMNEPDFIQDFHESVPKEVERLDKLVNDLLIFGKGSKIEAKLININRLLEEVIEKTNQNIADKKLAIKIAAELSSLPSINADEFQLRQVVLNLVNNAVEAMPNGGTIKVSSYMSPSNHFKIEDRDSIVIEVTDTGCGIVKADYKQLFDPFFTTKTFGTGLGLSICYRIINEHGGFLDFKSERHKGTTFWVVLPIEKSA
jgi:PAS domain S-box-containing protein